MTSLIPGAAEARSGPPASAQEQSRSPISAQNQPRSLVSAQAQPGSPAYAQAQSGSSVSAPAQAGFPASAELRRDPTSLLELRREAEKATKELEDATKALRDRQAKIRASEKELSNKLRELQAADRAFAQMRQPLSDIVGLLYQQPTGGDLAGFLSGETNDATLQAMADVTQIVAERDLILAESSRLQAEREKLAAQAQELRADRLLSEAQANAEIEALRARSGKIVKSLTQALVKLGVKVDKSGQPAQGCNPVQVGMSDQFSNGLIPKAYLCPLPQPGSELRGDAALAFISMNEAYKKQFGKPMCVTDSYRSLAEQQSVYYRRPGFAAVPGRSNHGLGLAVDLCGGVQQFRSPQFNWVEANSKKYGWFHPKWAYVSPFEPWHWEYDPKLGSLL
ncbi:D-alanyl-D-alanine carboxypeptidase family protein [Streptosporangium sandarakinum]|uniref:D-alanyl-D-alanine carboxypeptidase family protein n=1 Tax=Streptosporangium sandarakinum TaxID=1260955 RepID=UPI0036ADF2F0